MHRSLVSFLLLATALQATACTLDTAPAAEDRAEVGELEVKLEAAAGAVKTLGPYRMLNYHSGRCLEVPGNSTANNVWLDQWDCVSGRKTNEDWYLDFVDEYFFRIRNRHSGKCMNIEGGSFSDGAHVIQYTCGDYQNELFYRTGYSDRFYWVITPHDKALNIQSGSQDNGAHLIQWVPLNRSNEYFKFVPSATYE